MPIDVNVEQRLEEIAEATLQVAEELGTEAVTIRAVAERLGRSTTVITNYVPTRGALLLNAIEHALRAWRTELETEIEALRDEDRIEAIARWSVSTSGHDRLLRRLLLECLATAPGDSPVPEALRADAEAGREELRTAARDAGAADPDFATDVLHLALRGFYLSSVEEPGHWTSERATPIISRLTGLLVATEKAKTF